VAKLIVNPTSSARREISLARSLISIGRDPSNDVVLPDAMVSRRHAVIEFRGSQYFVRDCNSSNGSLVNGDRVSERNLRDGDLLAIGTARMLFREELEGEDSPAKVVQHPSAPKLHCPQCQADYRKGDQFCRQCGASVAPAAPAKAVCVSCGTVVMLPARFCNACGHVLSADAQQSAPAAAPPMVAPAPPPREASVAPPPIDATPQPAPPMVKPDTGPLPGGVGSPAIAAAPALEVVAPPRHDPAPKSPARLTTPPVARGPRSIPPRPLAVGPTGTASLPSAIAEAGFAPRLIAGVIDFAIVAALQALLLAPVAQHWWARELPPSPADVPYFPILVSLAMIPVAILLGGAYFAFFWGMKGATPGKRVVGLTVVAEDGTMPMGMSRATLRVLGYVVSTLLLGMGFLVIAFGGTALHDRMAGTRVVRRGTVA
jgi:uncharacterized RDD family membrane protein YckC